MRDGLERLLGDHLRLVPSAAGLHLTATFLDPRVDDRAVVAAAAEVGVAVEALSAYAVGDGVPPGLVLGYGALSTASVRPGLALLAQQVERTAPSR